MIKLVKTLTTELGAGGRRLIQILGVGKGDIQTPYQAAPFGIDSHPIKDLIAVQANTGEMGKTAIIGYINVEQLAELGELRLYSTDDAGVEKAYIWLKNDENIEIGGDTDFMVRYSALETAFNTLKQEFDAHVHPGVTAGAGVTSPIAVPSIADISGAKINDIKTR